MVILSAEDIRKEKSKKKAVMYEKKDHGIQIIEK